MVEMGTIKDLDLSSSVILTLLFLMVDGHSLEILKCILFGLNFLILRFIQNLALLSSSILGGRWK